MTEATISITTDRHLIRANGRSQRFVVARVTAPEAVATSTRPPVNLAIVLDRSGSMSGMKLETAKLAVAEAIGHLRSTDRFSVVVYDDKVDVVIESTPASAEARESAIRRLREIEARGSTDLGGGWLRGCEQVAAHLLADGVNRCLLLTDGLANVGIIDQDSLTGHAAALRDRGVSTSTFGVGSGFNEDLLASMADAGGGHFYYIEDAPQIRDAMASEVGEALEVVARDVALEVMTRDEVGVEAITPHRVSRRGSRSTIGLGDLVSEQVVEVVLRLTFPYGEIGSDIGAILSVTDRDRVFEHDGQAKLSWTYGDSHANDDQKRDRSVDRIVARMFAARAVQAAVAMNRAGDYDGAFELLEATAKRIASYAGKDREMLALVEDLRARASQFRFSVAEVDRKNLYYASSNLSRSRTPMGMAMRAAPGPDERRNKRA